MPQRKEIVTLDEPDLATLNATMRKEAMEKLLADIRRNLNEGLDQIRALAKRPDVDRDQAVEVRAVLQRRIERLESLGAEVADPAVRDNALRPLRDGVALCDQILATFSDQNQPVTATTSAGWPQAV